MSIFSQAMALSRYSICAKLVKYPLCTRNVYQKRQIHLNYKLYVKMFTDHENDYAYDIMRSNGYGINFPQKEVITSLTKDNIENFLLQKWIEKTPTELCTAFDNLSKYSLQHNVCISDKIFDSFIDTLTDKVKDLNDEQLESLFYSLNQWPDTESVRTRNFIEVWAALDDACLARMKEWSIDKLLFFTALTYMLNIVRVGDFPYKALQRLTSRWKQLTPTQLVQTLFYIGVLRKAPTDMHNLEVHLKNNFTKFTLDELAIMSMGFFKSRTPIRDKNLMYSILKKIIDESDDVKEVTLAALLKVTRYSLKISSDDHIFELLNALESQVHRFSVMCCVQIALVGTTTLTLHEKCLGKVAEIAVHKFSDARMKDLERLTLTFAVLNYEPPMKLSFFKKVLEELRHKRRAEEIVNYGRSFACCVAYLTMTGHYAYDLINNIMDKTFLDMTYGKNVYLYGREILTLHNIIEIYNKDYTGNRLTPKAVTILAKKYTDYVPDEDHKCQYNVSEKMFLDVMNTLRKERGGKEFVCGDHILPHYQRGDVILCNSQDGTPVKVSNQFPVKKFGTIQRPSNDDKWIVLIIGGRNAYIKDSNVVTGPFKSKVNELKALGFYPAVISWSIWSKLETHEDKVDHLNMLINESIMR